MVSEQESPIQLLSPSQANSPPQEGVERFVADLPIFEETLHIAVDATDEPIRTAQLVPLALAIDDMLIEACIHHAERKGLAIPCSEGCSHCCKSVVGFTRPEANFLLDVIQALPPDQRREIMQRFQQINHRAQSEGIVNLVESAPDLSMGLGLLGDWQHKNDITCPFLIDACCSIYDSRPATCREFMVTSPPETCQDFSSDRLELPFSIGLSLLRFQTALTDKPDGLAVMTFFQSWIDKRKTRGQDTYPANELVKIYLLVLSSLARQKTASTGGRIRNKS